MISARVAMRISTYCESKGNKDAVEYFEALLGFPATIEELKESTNFFVSLKPDDEGYDVLQRFKALLYRGELDHLGQVVLEFCLAWLIAPQLADFPTEEPPVLTFENIVTWSGAPYGFPSDYLQVQEIKDKILQLVQMEHANTPYYNQTLFADMRLLDYICGGKKLFSPLNECCKIVFADECVAPLQGIHQQNCDELVDELHHKPHGWYQLCGDDEDELLLIAKNAYATEGVNMLLIDFNRLFKIYQQNKEILWALKRELMLYDATICIHNVVMSGETVEKQAEFLTFLLQEMEQVKTSACFCTGENIALVPLIGNPIYCMSVASYTRSDRISLWNSIATTHNIQADIDSVDMGNRYQLTRGQIEKVITILKDRSEKITPHSIAHACETVLPPPGQGTIKKIHTTYTLEQLKLPPAQKQSLENICNHVRYRHQVYDIWNMESQFAYGRNISALFVGAPGTGKTMAVHVMANMLQLPLYRIDLSQVVDKYIGETEKRLEEIFSTAEKSNVILFFDEADSIFGKRSEVNDAKDKYANTEVSYILQRMEQYDGIVILATNYKKNIDEAFMRRIRYLVEFTLPNAELRMEIWKSSFAKEVPLDGIDFEYLSQQFEFAGGSIKNIVLNATFLAAASGQTVCMLDILESVRTENFKMGKMMLKQDFGQYSSIIADGI